MKKSLITNIYIYSMLSFFLFFTGFNGYMGIFGTKKCIFTALSILYIAISAIQGISFKKFGLAEISALIYLFITVLSAIVSEHFPETLLGVSRYEGLLTVGIYVFVFIFISQSWEVPTSFVPFLSAVMIFESLIVILQRCNLNVMCLFPKGENFSIAVEKYNGVFISTVGNADIASAFFCLMTPILFVLMLKQEKHRPLTFVSFVLSLSSVILISVSAGIVSLVAVAAVLPLVLFKSKRKLIITILCIVFVLSLILIYFLPLKSGMLFELQSIMKGNPDKTFGSGRLHIWSEVVENTRFFLGSGPDTMLYEGIEPFVKTVNGTEIVRKIDIAHNDYLNILFHQGIFALISYFGVLSPLLWWFKNKGNGAFSIAVGAGVFGYCVQVFFSFSACSSAVFFWIMLGILNAEQKRYE